ncbi:hypothetical protein COXBURSA331_A1794 [Coxiella burnetii RSA 331]|nr:hypothetical protein COXBURSA331_A1794 [Coxiella burnetii RSA 331]
MLFEIFNFLKISTTDNFFSFYIMLQQHKAVASAFFDKPRGLPPNRLRARAALRPASVRAHL